ncbi:MAG: hypothetical protein OXP66_02860 [Candidatus Tectomicrobia bacterium]|nr:hypothetical protein [Candidatus Tectomicrobia bacterium]
MFDGRTEPGCRMGAQQYDPHDLGEQLVTHLHGRTGQRMELPNGDTKAMWWIGSRSP